MVVGPAIVFGLATVATVIALVLFADHTSTVLRIYFATLGLFIGLQAVRNFAAYAFGGEGPNAARAARTPRSRAPNWPTELFDLEARVSLAKVSAFDYESRLRPLLRELAAQRLAAHWNVDLATQRPAAHAHVHDALWAELVEDVPADARDRRFVPGPSVARINDLIQDLEAI
jgi:hypothetical protein